MSSLLAMLLLAALPGAIEPAPSLLEPIVPIETPSEDRRDTLPPERHDQPQGPRPKTYLIGALETAAVLGTGTWWYWSGKPPADTWDLRWDWQSWRTKMDGQALRFDADLFETNASSHPRAGVYYYQIARGNGLTYAQSYVWSFVASFLWEYFVEWNEFPSINDIVLTPTSGSVLGESTYRLGRFFDAGAPTLVNRAGAALFSPFATLNDIFTGRKPAADPPYDGLGFTSTGRHIFLFAVDRLACFANGERQDQTALNLDTFLVSYRGYRRPGKVAATVSPGDWTELGVRLFFAQGNVVAGANLHSGTLITGRYFRHYAERTPDETWRTAKPRGWGVLLGLGSSFDYDTRELQAGLDKVASAGLVGPMAELTAERGSFGVRLAFHTYYSFSLVESMAFLVDGDPMRDVYINSTLRNQGYYYAHGTTSAATLDVRLGMLELTFRGRFGAFWGLNGRDRFQDKIQVDLSPFDTRASGVAVASFRPFGGPLRLDGTVEHIQRYGRAAGIAGSSDETRAGFGAGFVF